MNTSKLTIIAQFNKYGYVNNLSMTRGKLHIDQHGKTRMKILNAERNIKLPAFKYLCYVTMSKKDWSKLSGEGKR